MVHDLPLRDHGALDYVPLEKLTIARPVDRIDHIRQTCSQRRVLDLGALDETAYRQKRGTSAWLHTEIARFALEVVGIDRSPLVPEAGLRTAGNATIHRCDEVRLPELLESLRFEPDVVVAGELIEHVPCPLEFLQGLRSIKQLAGKRLLLTTPNATAFHNVLIAVSGRESTHRDHLCILSYKTLTTLLSRAGFERFGLRPYFARFPEMAGRHRGWRAALVSGGERGVNAIEWLFPLLSFGWIVEAEI